MRYNKILLVDDDEDDQEIFITALKKLEFPVKCNTYTSAENALKHLKDNSLKTDLIFLDLNMPIMNGQQFLVEIKKEDNLKNIPVIIFSTSSHLPTKQLMKDLGALDFITKPADFNELLDILKSTLN